MDSPNRSPSCLHDQWAGGRGYFRTDHMTFEGAGLLGVVENQQKLIRRGYGEVHGDESKRR